MNVTDACGAEVLWSISEDQEKIIVEELIYEEPGLIYRILKRSFDIVFSIIGIAVMLIPILILSAAIAIDSPGGVFYSQIRLGKNQKPFMIYKLRTMRRDAESESIQWASENDPRVTRIGRFLRSTRLDELPQLVNILLGDMSFVGPRPERPEFYDIFDRYIVGFRQRTLVTPGLTGYAQVNGGYELRPEEKIVYDIEYIKNQSVKTDIACIFKTVGVVFGKKGSR